MEQKAVKAKARLKQLFAEHQKAILLFSGGKDSLVIHHLCRNYLDRITVVWVNTGAGYPHMAEFIRQFNVVEINSNQPAHITEYGYPSDIVPVINTHDGVIHKKPASGPRIQDWRQCCLKNRWLPASNYIRASDATLAINGQRNDDEYVAVQDGIVSEGKQGCMLIKDWTQEEVYDYLKQHKIKLPRQYPQVQSSGDCWNCTAFLDADHYDYLEREYPDHAQVYAASVASVYGAVLGEFDRLEPTIQRICRNVINGNEDQGQNTENNAKKRVDGADSSFRGAE